MYRRKFIQSIAPILGGVFGISGSILSRRQIDYYTWSWEKWKKTTNASSEIYHSDQVGESHLVDLLKTHGREIETEEDWLIKRKEIKNILLQVMGDFPSLTTWLNPRILAEKDFEKYTRRKIVYNAEPDDEVTAYLFIPKNGAKKNPAVLCPHQTNPFGKQEAAGIKGDPALALASKLAKRGYVTLAPDAICFGERHNPLLGHYGEAMAFYKKHPTWSIAGKMIWDKSRAIDYLWSLEEVNPHRIGTIGHSHGGYGSLMAAAFDERIQCTVSSCGFTTFRADGNTFRWSHATPIMPKLGFYLGDTKMTWETFQEFKLKQVNQVPFDWHHILALISPRPVFLSVSLDDKVFPHCDQVKSEVLPRIHPIYGLSGSLNKFETHFFNGGHSFPLEAQTKAFSWLDQWLK